MKARLFWPLASYRIAMYAMETIPATADMAGSMILRVRDIGKKDIANPVTGIYTDVIMNASTVRRLLGTTISVSLRIARNMAKRIALAATLPYRNLKFRPAMKDPAKEKTTNPAIIP